MVYTTFITLAVKRFNWCLLRHIWWFQWLIHFDYLQKRARPHLYIAMNHIVVVAVPKCLQNLPHVVAVWTESRNRQGGDHLGHPQIVVYFSY